MTIAMLLCQKQRVTSLCKGASCAIMQCLCGFASTPDSWPFPLLVLDNDLFWAPSTSPNNGPNSNLNLKSHGSATVDQMNHNSSSAQLSYDLDHLEDMRFRGDLLYLAERHSPESDEHKCGWLTTKLKKESPSKPTQIFSTKRSERKSKFVLGHHDNLSRNQREFRSIRKVVPYKPSKFSEDDIMHKEFSSKTNELWSIEEKTIERNKKSLSFKEMTDPFMRPFCLDIFISRSSVCACIVHRPTCKVVAVAQSISKDLKCELASRKDFTACATVAAALAERALADDIYTAVYTPRKEEKLEGKRMVILQTLIDHGLSIEVKLKAKPNNLKQSVSYIIDDLENT